MSNPGARSIAMGVAVENVSPEELYQVIVSACSQDGTQVRNSGERLKRMLEMFGTYDYLQAIAAQRNNPLPVRTQAIIQFKNAVVNHWRSRKLLSDEHRAQIRQRCLSFIDEPDETIAECNVVVVTKLARTDYPQTWPNLIDTLMHAIDVNLTKRYIVGVDNPLESLILRRSLKLLNGILKEFAGVKLPNGMKVMAQIVGQTKGPLYQYYSQMSITFSSDNITKTSAASHSMSENILLSHLVFKCLVKITGWLWAKNNRLSPEELAQNQLWVQEFFSNAVVQLRALIETRKRLVAIMIQEKLEAGPFVQTIILLTKHIRVFGKLFRRLQQLAHERFVSLPMAPELILFYWSEVVESSDSPQEFITDSDQAPYPVRFLVQGMVLFKESLSQWTAVKRNGQVNSNTLSVEFVENAVRLLVTKFIPLNPLDLENWVSDPEEWVNLEDKEHDQWEYEIRACAERLLVQLCNQFPDTVVHLLTEIFNEVARKQDLTGILSKEAVYCAIGRCALRLKDKIPFDDWLKNRLAMECRDTNANYPIIKRRIAWLLGKWVSSSSASPNNPAIWEVLSYLLHDRTQGSDAVVRLTAAVALRECVDAVTFDPNYFAPFLPTIIPELIRLMSEAETMESKRRVDESLNIIIEQSGPRVLPFINTITEPIPHLWTSAGSDLLFKASLLVTMTKLIEAIKEHSTPLATLVVPLIRDSLSPEGIMQLDEDALELWHSALRNTTSTDSSGNAPGLKDLIPQAIHLLSTNLDLLGSVTRIVESHLILDGAYILGAYGNLLFQGYLSAFNGKILDVNMKELIQTLNLLLLTTPSNLWGELLHISGLFPYLLRTLIANEVETLIATELVYLFSRIIMADRSIFLQLMAASVSVLNQNETVLFEGLLDQWWGKFDNMSEPRHRKLAAMGIAVLVSTGRPEVLKRLSGEIFNLWLDVLGELKEAMEQAANRSESEYEPASPTSLVRYWELDTPPASYFGGSEGSPEEGRRKAIYANDPIRTIHLAQFISQNLQQAEAVCSPTVFPSYLADADPTVVKQIQDALAQS